MHTKPFQKNVVYDKRWFLYNRLAFNDFLIYKCKDQVVNLYS